MNNDLKELKIEVTQKCPLNCLHCSSEANIAKTQELSEDIVYQLINDSKTMGIKEITFSGGEPLIWEPIIRVIDYSISCGIETVLYTTGNPVIDDERLLNKLNGKKVKIIISLYGASGDAHERITRVNGSFNKTIASIRDFHRCGILVGIHFVAMGPNWRELEKVVALANKLKVNSLSILRFVPHGRGAMVNHYNLNKPELRRLKQEIVRLRASSKTFIRIGSPFNILLLDENVNCTAAVDRLVIGSNGLVYPCDAFKNVDYEGELSSVIENTLQDVWNGSAYLKKIRSIIAQGLGPNCSKCQNCMICKGGCLAQKVIRIYKGVLKTNNVQDPDCLL